MHEPDLAKTKPQQLLERALLPITRRLRRHPRWFIDGDPVVALPNDGQFRRIFDDRDTIISINLARCDRYDALIHQHPPRRDQLARLPP